MIRKCIKCKVEKDHLELMKPKTGYYWCDKCYNTTKTKLILRNDPAKKRKKLGKVKDLLDAAVDDAQMFEFDIAMGVIRKIK